MSHPADHEDHFADLVRRLSSPSNEALDLMRILLAGMSNMLTSIITAALEQSPEMKVAGIASERDDLAGLIRLAQADAVVMQVAEPGASLRYRDLLLSFPALKVIAIASDGKGGFVHELCPWSTQIIELSTETLLTALGAKPTRSLNS